MTTEALGTEAVQAVINDYWTRRAPAYDDYQQRPERRDDDVRVWSEVWRGALPDTRSRVLDVGTGSGHAACLIAGLGHDVVGIDLSEGMLARARQHAERLPDQPSFQQGDAISPDFGDSEFDALVGRYVLWTLRDPDAAARNWLRLLRPGAVVAMVDSMWFPQGLGGLYGPVAARHVPLAEADSIERSAEVLRAAGFADVRVEELRSVLELDQRHGVAPGHQVQLQYLITGRRPIGARRAPIRDGIDAR